MALSSIKNLFIQTEDTEVDSSSEEKSIESEKQTESKVSSSSASKTISNAEVGKFVDVLFKEIEKSNLEGYDYLEFKTSVEELVESGLQKEQAIKAASIAVKSLTTPKAILDSIEHYLQIIDKNKKDFEKNVILKLKDKISEEEKELNSTISEIERLRKLETELRKSIDSNQIKIENNSQGFNEAYKLVLGSMKEDEKTIKKVLGAG
ncbi:MAG: hypothetical protein GW761_01470 [Leptospira sp.]|jgi:hypothetical protein|nr:hypothetical protein [Leptospira sp.]